MQTNPAARPGRPRPLETVRRDEAILARLDQGPASTRTLAGHLGISEDLVRVAMRRLVRARMARRQLDADGSSVWHRSGS